MKSDEMFQSKGERYVVAHLVRGKEHKDGVFDNVRTVHLMVQEMAGAYAFVERWDGHKWVRGGKLYFEARPSETQVMEETVT